MSVIPPASTPVDPKEVFRAATWHEHAANQLVALLPKQNAKYRPQSQAFPAEAVPMLIASAFATELYLKSLCQVESGTPSPPRGHPLALLYGKLSPSGQANVRRFYDGLVAVKPPPRGANPAGMSDQEVEASLRFDQALQTSSDTFVLWRYTYEMKMEKGAYMLYYLCFAARRAVTEVRPQWVCLEAGLNIVPTSQVH